MYLLPRCSWAYHKACRAGGLGLISSTLLHFGKASEFALHSASATPGIASELALLSLCAMVKVVGRADGIPQGLMANYSNYGAGVSKQKSAAGLARGAYLHI